MFCMCAYVCGRTVMLLSITSDNSGLPEAFAANIIKSSSFIYVTQTTPGGREATLCVFWQTSHHGSGFPFPNLGLCPRLPSKLHLCCFRI